VPGAGRPGALGPEGPSRCSRHGARSPSRRDGGGGEGMRRSSATARAARAAAAAATRSAQAAAAHATAHSAAAASMSALPGAQRVFRAPAPRRWGPWSAGRRVLGATGAGGGDGRSRGGERADCSAVLRLCGQGVASAPGHGLPPAASPLRAAGPRGQLVSARFVGLRGVRGQSRWGGALGPRGRAARGGAAPRPAGAAPPHPGAAARTPAPAPRPRACRG
jgi:hypothetical protein